MEETEEEMTPELGVKENGSQRNKPGHVGWIHVSQNGGPVKGYCKRAEDDLGSIKKGQFLTKSVTDIVIKKVMIHRFSHNTTLFH